jgi:hypothetical protein
VARTLYYFERIINFDPPSGEKGVVYTLTHLPRRLDEILFFCSEEDSDGEPGIGPGASSNGISGRSERSYAVFMLMLFWLGTGYSLFFA